MADKPDAIEDDVAAEEQDEKETIDQERLDFLDEIDAQNEVADEEYQKEQLGEPEGEEEPEPDTEDVATEEETLEQPSEEEETVRLIIDGEEKDVPLSEVTDAGKRAMQKQLAADKRLEEATQLLREAKERALPSEQDVPSTKTPSDTERIDAAALAKAIQYGTEDEAAAALADFKNASTVTPERVTELVEARVKQLEQEQAQKAFWDNVRKKPEDGGFSDLMEDEVVGFPAFMAASERLLQKGEPNQWETYQKAGEEVRTLLKKRYSGGGLESKKAQKRAAAEKAPPKGANLRSAPVEENYETDEEYINRLSEARG